MIKCLLLSQGCIVPVFSPQDCNVSLARSPWGLTSNGLPPRSKNSLYVEVAVKLAVRLFVSVHAEPGGHKREQLSFADVWDLTCNPGGGGGNWLLAAAPLDGRLPSDGD